MLKQEKEQAQAEWQHVPFATPLPLDKEARFDKYATTEILETAAKLQRAERDTLTQAEIETLAAEMGLSVRHVRQAIALSGRQTAHYPRLTRVRLTRRQKGTVLLTPLVYSLYMIILVNLTWGLRNYDVLLIGSLFVLPAVIVLWLGGQLRYKRAGAAAGIVFLVAMIAGIAAGIVVHEGELPMPQASDYGPPVFMLLGAIFFGTAGAALRQWFEHRQLPFVPTATQPSDLDR